MVSSTDSKTHDWTSLRERLRRASGWRELIAALQSGRSGTIDGAWGSSASVALSALAQQLPMPLTVVVPTVSELIRWQGDLTTFSGIAPVLFPANETWPAPLVRGRLNEEAATRLRTLQQLSAVEPPSIVLAPMAAMLQPVPAREDLTKSGQRIQVGATRPIEELLTWLTESGYKRVDAVEYAGEFSRRGGILDIFPPDALDPVRLEFFGDECESIRVFTIASQRSLEKRNEILLLRADSTARPGQAPDRGHYVDYLPAGAVVVLVEPQDLREQGRHFYERVRDPSGLFTVEGATAALLQRATVVLSALPRPTVEAAVHLRVESVERFSGQVSRVRDELDAVAQTDEVWIACQTEAEIRRLEEVLKAGQLEQSHRLKLALGHVQAGFRLIQEQLLVLGSQQLFHRDLTLPGTKQSRQADAKSSSRTVESRAIDSFLELNEGDYVVHVAHGIARFRGMKMLARSQSGIVANGAANLFDSSEQETLDADILEENIILEFRDGVLLYVPASRIDLIQRYIGGSQVQPELSKFGGTAWQRKKERVSEAIRDLAAEMIQIQAVRNAVPGHAYPEDSEWQREFEDSFPFQETPDQAMAIAEIKQDLQRPKPMDRLLCGDVGYGKTEVAIRAAFKAIDHGKQVALLVPTTVLAEQHYRTFTQRLADYPFTVEVVSRFKSAQKQKEAIKRVADGSVDILIGTHRVLSKDVKFKDLGLVIIDEEQRFGVEHKERLKQLRTSVDVLTMTATPIPRTLHSALMGIREISNLQTPPLGRLPVETRIIRWDDELIRHAILREMNRGGQVYFVHNRVQDIQTIADEVARLVPEAKIVVGHGQMGEGELEKAMVKFVAKEADILVATTIIESGLDIPSANTMIIHEAENYGLADLHQLRGRVGRTKLRAYAYLVVDAKKMVSSNAAKRLKAIEEFSELGAGFKIAMRDLEIRGAGNILGAEQSGHIAAIGYEMYCQLLDNAVRQLKHLPPRAAIEVNIDLPWPGYLPRDFVPGQKLRIEIYRRLARLRDLATLEDFRSELIDRYGKLPEAVEWLLKATQIRILCVKHSIATIHRDQKDLVLTYRNKKKAEQLAARSKSRLKVVDEKHLYLRLKLDLNEDEPIQMFTLLQGLMS